MTYAQSLVTSITLVWNNVSMRIEKVIHYLILTSMEIPALRNDGELNFPPLPVVFYRYILDKLNKSYEAFFRRVEKGQNLGFPRFKAFRSWKTIGIAEWAGCRIENNRFCLNGLGGSKKGSGIRVNFHRPLPEEYKIKACTLTLKNARWKVNLSLEIPDAIPVPYEEDKLIAFDFGLENTLIRQDGFTIERVRVTERHIKKRKKLQRRKCFSKKGSRSSRRQARDISRLYEREANARETRLHQIASQVIDMNVYTAMEDLAIKNMTRSASGTIENPGKNVAQKTGLNKAILDSAPAKLFRFICYKAEKAGGRCVGVNPRNTSQKCSGCGTKVKKDLKERWHECKKCGLSLHRDENAARNILVLGKKAMQIPKPQKVKRRFSKKKTLDEQSVTLSDEVIENNLAEIISIIRNNTESVIRGVVTPVSSIGGLEKKPSNLRTDTIVELQSSKSGISFEVRISN